MSCSILLDGLSQGTNNSVTNNSAVNFSFTGLTEDTHYWNVSCADNVNNSVNTSTYRFTISIQYLHHVLQAAVHQKH